MLEQIVKAIITALLDWLAKRQTTIENAKTTNDIRNKWRDYISNELRNKKCGDKPAK